MMRGRCDCGGVTVDIPAKPDSINACPCSYCTAIGARWAYFPPATLEIRGETDTYRRGEKSIAFHRCATCGTLICWRADDAGTPVMGVHTALFPADDLSDVPVTADPPRSER